MNMAAGPALFRLSSSTSTFYVLDFCMKWYLKKEFYYQKYLKIIGLSYLKEESGQKARGYRPICFQGKFCRLSA